MIKKTKIKHERIENIKTWLKPQFIKYIQIFQDNANIYKIFIRNFSKIAILLNSILKTNISDNGSETNIFDNMVVNNNIVNKVSFSYTEIIDSNEILN